LLSFYVYEQRLCHVFAVYVIAMHVNRSENRKINQFTALHRCVYVQKLSHAFAMYICVTYMSCNACAKTLLLFCVYKQRLCCVFAVYVIALHVHQSDKAKNRSIYCIMQMCRCAKAESCLCNICVYIIYEFNMWIKCCYCFMCDCAACKSIWKCEKSINLLHHICLYMRKSWVMPLQYMCVYHIWVQHVNKVLLLLCMWLRCV